MSFSDLFKRLITRNPLRKNRRAKRSSTLTPKDTPTAVQAQSGLSEKTADTALTVSEENKEVSRQKTITVTPPIYVTRQNALLLVVYQDMRGTLLFPSQIISGRLGEPLRLQFQTLPDYNLVKIKGFTSYFASHYGIITLTYAKKDAGVIWILCRDIDTQYFLTDPQLVKGKVREPYQLFSPTLAGYNLLRVKGTLRGDFSYDQSFVTFYYRRSTWKDLKKTESYLKIVAPITSYDQPEGVPLNISFALNTVWRTFTSLTLENGDLWYCLGGALWIKFDRQKVIYSNKRSETLLPEKTRQLDRHFKKPRKAVIDFIPGKCVNVYDAPFGQKVELIKDKTQVTVTAHATIDDLIWYKLSQNVWLPRQYLKFI
ncbi:MucBP domain-containing protein [Liquorilactobacillus capillatus]|uniref:MucBP domain-containing protein n=1 Tax=Liquorilactobacillus capillatus TaxID=480931 RepID=UPI00070D984B|nr:MucBP domain-containing protein [Liquorilactobacillus capillatus]